jgi:hypothetical protein
VVELVWMDNYLVNHFVVRHSVYSSSKVRICIETGQFTTVLLLVRSAGIKPGLVPCTSVHCYLSSRGFRDAVRDCLTRIERAITCNREPPASPAT